MRNTILILLSVLVMLSCSKAIDLDLPDYEPELSIEGRIENGSPPMVIFSKTQGFFDPVDLNSLSSNFVSGATITINDGTTTYPLTEICTASLPDSLLTQVSQLTGIPEQSLQFFNYCIYTSFDFASFGQPGKTYYLTAVAEGKTLTAKTKIPDLIALDELWYQRGENQDSLGFIWATLTDPDTIGNSYRWYAQRINKYTYGELEGQMKDPFQIAPFGSSFDDKFFNGLEFEFAYNRGEIGNMEGPDDEGPEEGFFKDNDTVVVKYTTIDRKTFFYLRALENSAASAGSPFATAGNIPSNVKNGHGFFMGFGAVYDTVICVP